MEEEQLKGVCNTDCWWNFYSTVIFRLHYTHLNSFRSPLHFTYNSHEEGIRDLRGGLLKGERGWGCRPTKRKLLTMDVTKKLSTGNPMTSVKIMYTSLDLNGSSKTRELRLESVTDSSSSHVFESRLQSLVLLRIHMKCEDLIGLPGPTL